MWNLGKVRVTEAQGGIILPGDASHGCTCQLGRKKELTPQDSLWTTVFWMWSVRQGLHVTGLVCMAMLQDGGPFKRWGVLRSLRVLFMERIELVLIRLSLFLLRFSVGITGCPAFQCDALPTAEPSQCDDFAEGSQHRSHASSLQSFRPNFFL